MENYTAEITNYLRTAKEFAKNKKYKDAIPVLETALEMADSESIKILILEELVECTNAVMDEDKTLRYLEQLCDLDLAFENALSLITHYTTFNNFEKSYQFSKRFKDIRLRTEGDRLKLLHLYVEAGAFEEAFDVYEQWRANNPDDIDIKLSFFSQFITNGAFDFTDRAKTRLSKLYKLAEELIAEGWESEVYVELATLYSKLYLPKVYMDYYRKAAAAFKEKNDTERYHLVLNQLYMKSNYNGLLEDDEYIRIINEICKAGLPQTVNTSFDVNTNYLKKIRVGFVSSDFNNHSVGKFIASLFKQRISNSEVELYCYYTRDHKDNVTELISQYADCFKYMGNYYDAQIGEEMLNDKLDIVIDLNNRSVGSKLILLSERLAPIQMTWMGFPFTTAIPNIDYNIGDPNLDPPDNSTEKFLTEKVARMKPSYMCYSMDLNRDFIKVADEPPCVKNGYITFGNMNSPAKFSPHTLRLWKRVLEAVPSSRLYIKLPEMDDFVRGKFIETFTSEGIDWNRIVVTPTVNQLEYMNAYNDIDILLDTTPFSGCTTLAESFFIGMPTISLKGDYRQSRHFVLLEQVGLGDLAANNDDDYVNKAAALANNVERIRHIKKNLPVTIKSSPLFDSLSFRLSFENMIRQTYVRYCYKNKKPFDPGAYKGNFKALTEDCLRAQDVLTYLIEDGEDPGLLMSIVSEYILMAALLLSKIPENENTIETINLSLEAISLLSRVKDAPSATTLVNANNKLLAQLVNL